jgi:hypothetical protein
MNFALQRSAHGYKCNDADINRFIVDCSPHPQAAVFFGAACLEKRHDIDRQNDHRRARQMKSFECARCHNKVYFESVSCLKCGAALGFYTETMLVVPFVAAEQSLPKSPAVKASRPKGGAIHGLRYCANAAHGVCNWLTAANHERCLACQMNRTIPNLSEPGSLTAWRELERAKKRLVYGLLRFGLPLALPLAPALAPALAKPSTSVPSAVASRSRPGKVQTGDAVTGPLTFDFARNTVTGHRDGVITIDVLEADAVERERLRQRFGEVYRSLLGHLRHECGHFYWAALVETPRGNGGPNGRTNDHLLQEYRSLFGDERQDYAAALAGHHASPRTDWQATYVSAYASAHPWEDWAETFAHYLHLVDAVDTAEAEGMEPRPGAKPVGFSLSAIFASRRADVYIDVYTDVTFSGLMERWTPLALGLNSLSRSIGHADFYPFIIPPPVVEKLAFVHRVVRAGEAVR